MISIKRICSLFVISIFISACSENDVNAPTANPNLINLKQTGNSANELLSDKEYKSLTLEIVSVKGFEPTNETVDSFVDFIEKRTFKPNGINIIRRSIDSPNEESLTIKEVDALEKKNRTAYSTATDHAIYLYFADAENIKTAETKNKKDKEREIILGTAYRNTSIVIYEKTIRDVANSNKLTNVETSILNHEFCHLLGLVNLGTRMQIPHEGSEDGEKGHCNVAGCLMQAGAAFENDMMGSVKVLELDPLCIKDLQGNGGR